MRMRRKRYNGKRKFRSKYTKPSTISRVRGVGYPDRIVTKLKYVDSFGLSSSPVANYIYRGNSLYDPDVTTGGHQPLFYDQYIAVYEKYRVFGSSIRIQVVNESTVPAYVIITPSTSPVTLTTVSAILEQNRASSLRVILPNGYNSSSQKRYCSTKQATGVTYKEILDQDYAATYGANPINLWYWNLFAESIDNTTNLSLRFIVTITFYCEFFDRQNVAQS